LQFIITQGGIFMERAHYAAELFLEGYNCAQAVSIAFCDLTGFSKQQAAKMASAFGGGMGRMREVCGAVTGMYLVLSQLYGYDSPDDVAKKALYTDVQALAAQFRERTGSIICREILKNPPSDPNPTPRTAEFYRQRPCARMVMTAAELLDGFLAEHPLEERHG
jgi:C_GCAxxG_C_C family probable redox protein